MKNYQGEIRVKSYLFRVVIEKDESATGKRRYHGYCPALKGCHTWGHNQGETLTNIQKAVALYVEDLMDAGESIPVDPDHGVIEMSSPSVVVNV